MSSAGRHPRLVILATLVISLTMMTGSGNCSPSTRRAVEPDAAQPSPSTSDVDVNSNTNGGNVVPLTVDDNQSPDQQQPETQRKTAQFPGSEDRRPVTTTTGSTFETNPSSPPPAQNTLLDSISESNAMFTWDIYKGMAFPAEENVFFSPYSIVNALGMLAMGSGQGPARDQLIRALRVDPALPDDALDRGIQQENQHLRTQDKSSKLQLLVANKFYVDRGRASNINPQYLQNISDFYGGSMQAVNFSTDLAGTVRLINGWVSDQTRGMIKDLVPDTLDPQTQLILANAIFFNGTWESTFNPDQNFQAQFHLAPSVRDGADRGSVPVQMMTQTNSLLYAADDQLGVETVVLPYTGEPKLAMHIILPNENRPLSSLERDGTLNAKALRELATQARRRIVQLSMPKFSLQQEMELSELMQRLNATDVFHPLKNDFSNIFLNTRPGFFVNEILHQAKVEVDERGTVAAAATAVIGTRSSFPRHPVLVNRPFLFYIADESNGFILFWGRVSDPSKSK